MINYLRPFRIFVRSGVSSQNIQISLLTKTAKLTPAINELSVSIYLSMLRMKANLEGAKRLHFLFWHQSTFKTWHFNLSKQLGNIQ